LEDGGLEMTTTIDLRRQNLKKWIDEKYKGVQANFVNAIDINQGELSALLKNKSFGEKKARKIEKIAGMPEMWLDTPHSSLVNQNDSEAIQNNVIQLDHTIHRIPLVSWVQAGNWREIELIEPDDYEWVLAVSNVSSRAFALRIQGDSMQPEFTEGDVIICDPEAQWHSGSYIVVIQDDNHATFKRVVYDGGRPMLKALNPVYGVIPMKDNAVVCGVVKEKVKRY